MVVIWSELLGAMATRHSRLLLDGRNVQYRSFDGPLSGRPNSPLTAADSIGLLRLGRSLASFRPCSGRQAADRENPANRQAQRSSTRRLFR
jgi:hypothetical protein